MAALGAQLPPPLSLLPLFSWEGICTLVYDMGMNLSQSLCLSACPIVQGCQKDIMEEHNKVCRLEVCLGGRVEGNVRGEKGKLNTFSAIYFSALNCPLQETFPSHPERMVCPVCLIHWLHTAKFHPCFLFVHRAPRSPYQLGYLQHWSPLSHTSVPPWLWWQDIHFQVAGGSSGNLCVRFITWWCISLQSLKHLCCIRVETLAWSPNFCIQNKLLVSPLTLKDITALLDQTKSPSSTTSHFP